MLPIFKRTIGLGRHVERLDQERQLKSGLVETVPFGVLLVSPEREVRFMNRAAQRITEAADGLSGKGNKLRLADPAADLALSKLLRLAGAPNDGQLPSGGLLEAPRPSGRPQLLPLCDSLRRPRRAGRPGGPIRDRAGQRPAGGAHARPRR